mgnify:CR=1 FL=1
MAKKPAAAPKEEPKAVAVAGEPKYTVDSLVEATGLQPASVRVALRELGVEKAFGNKYGWDKKADFDEVVKAMKERSAKRLDLTKKEPEPAPAPAKGKKAATAPAAPAKGKGKKAA